MTHFDLPMFLIGAGIAVIVYSLNVLTFADGAQWTWPPALYRGRYHAVWGVCYVYDPDTRSIAQFVLTWITLLVNALVVAFLLRAALVPLFSAHPELVKLLPLPFLTGLTYIGATSA